MNLSFFLKGLIIGFSIAAPVGPIGVLCIRRTLAWGRAAGFLSGLGAATADALYGCVAGFGVTFVSGFLLREQDWLKLVGGAFLCYLGVKTFLARPAQSGPPGAEAAPATSLSGAYTSTLFLTLTNPATILSFAAIFTGLGIAGRDYLSGTLLVLGVFVGSALWWLILSGSVSLFRARFNSQRLLWVNRLSGLVVGGFGLAALLSLA